MCVCHNILCIPSFPFIKPFLLWLYYPFSVCLSFWHHLEPISSDFSFILRRLQLLNTLCQAGPSDKAATAPGNWMSRNRAPLKLRRCFADGTPSFCSNFIKKVRCSSMIAGLFLGGRTNFLRSTVKRTRLLNSILKQKFLSSPKVPLGSVRKRNSNYLIKSSRN